MAVFNASFANPSTKKPTSTDYGFLVDGLSIRESQLASDGKLSPGDYQILRDEAQKIYGHPGLTPDQRSNIEVKMASYAKSGSVTALDDGQNLTRLNNEYKDTLSTLTQLFGNDPEKFLNGKQSLIAAKIEQLTNSINQRSRAGDDASSHINELNAALEDYSDITDALKQSETAADGAVKTDYVAYVTTNARGEIVDMDVGRFGSKSGYIPTNGTYGGFQLYGKTNRNENGKNVFQLGQTRFVEGTDLVTSADGISQQKKLFAEGTSGVTRGYGTNTAYIKIEPTTVSTQSSVPSGGFVEGKSGTFYQRRDDGTYTKFVNYTKDDLKSQFSADDGSFIRLPDSNLDGIIGNSRETVDKASAQVLPQANAGSAFPSSSDGIPHTPAPQSVLDQARGRPSTGSPTQNSPTGILDYAQRAASSAQGFLQGIFGGK